LEFEDLVEDEFGVIAKCEKGLRVGLTDFGEFDEEFL